MKNMVTNMVSFLMAAVVMMVSSGYTVFHHSCQSEQSSEYSLLAPDFTCDHYQASLEQIPPCCQAEEDHAGEACGTDNCCETETYTVKLQITLMDQNVNKTLDYSIIEHFIPVTEETQLLVSDISFLGSSNDLPPPRSGKALHVFLNQLNIPYPAV